MGVEGAVLSFQGFGIVTTGYQGKWSKGKLKGEVRVSIAKEGWRFAPISKRVTGAAADVGFKGAQVDDYEVVDVEKQLARTLFCVLSGVWGGLTDVSG
ncbi:MAG: hypothetical protein ACOYES_09075 [Bacillota bacterium]